MFETRIVLKLLARYVVCHVEIELMLSMILIFGREMPLPSLPPVVNFLEISFLLLEGTSEDEYSVNLKKGSNYQSRQML